MPRPAAGTTRRLLLARHGLTTWNAEHRWQGSRDIPLSDEGRAQARALGLRLSRVALAAAVSSDLSRAQETVTLAVGSRLAPHAEPLLREMSYGAWEGVQDHEVARLWPEEHAAWRGTPHLTRPGGGESLEEVEERAWRGLVASLQRSPDGDVLVVAHGGVNRLLLGRLLGQPRSRFWSLQQSPTGLTILELPAASPPEEALAGARVVLLNCTRHLDPGESG